MSRMDSRRGLSDDARFELAMNAAGHARRNRPSTMLVAAGAALALALAAAVWGLSARASARAGFRREQGDLVQVQQLSDEWKRLDESAKQSGNADATAPFAHLQSTIEACARGAGLKATPQPPRVNPNPRGAVTANEYVYHDVRDPSLPALLEWIRQSTAQVPGLEVYSLDLHPQATEWSVDVTFRRIERTGS